MSEENIKEKNVDNHSSERKSIFGRININTLLNIICLLGITALFIVYFSDTDKKLEMDSTKIKNIEETFSDAAIKIAIINTDKLVEQYEFAHNLREEMYVEQERLESDLTRRQRDFQREVERFQNQIQRGLITMDEAQIKERELMQKQQDLLLLNEQYTQRLRQKELDFNVELFDSISSFIKRYNIDYGFDFVLDHSASGGVLYAGEDYDITDDFIERINR